MSLNLDRRRPRRQPLTPAEIREAIDGLVARGVIRVLDDNGVERFALTGQRPGKAQESREGGQR